VPRRPIWTGRGAGRRKPKSFAPSRSRCQIHLPRTAIGGWPRPTKQWRAMNSGGKRARNPTRMARVAAGFSCGGAEYRGAAISFASVLSAPRCDGVERAHRCNLVFRHHDWALRCMMSCLATAEAVFNLSGAHHNRQWRRVSGRGGLSARPQVAATSHFGSRPGRVRRVGPGTCTPSRSQIRT
jgi:hypothetical protein